MLKTLEQIPSFGDGYLTGIEVGEKNAILGLQRYDGPRYQLRLSGVEGLLANEFREGNIISSLKVTTGSTIDIRDLTLLWPCPHPNAAVEYHQKHQSFLEKQQNKIASGNAVWINLTASYGCDLMAVCGSVELVELNITPDGQIQTEL